MTVEELIAALQSLPPEVRQLPVLYWSEAWIEEVNQLEVQTVHRLASESDQFRVGYEQYVESLDDDDAPRITVPAVMVS